MAYSYRKPVMYDSQINRNCLKMLSFGPVVYVFSAAWTFSNQQVFFGDVVFDTTQLLFQSTNHTAKQLWTQISPATLYVIPITLMMMLSVYYIFSLMVVSKSKTMLEDDIVYQSLEPFFKSLTSQTRENWLREAVQSKKRLDIPKLSEEAFLRLAKLSHNGNQENAKLKGVHNYDILMNPEYANMYHYIPCIYPQRNDYVIS